MYVFHFYCYKFSCVAHSTIVYYRVMIQITIANGNCSSVGIVEISCRVMCVAFDGNDHITFDVVNYPTMTYAQIAIVEKYQIIWFRRVTSFFQASLPF